MQKEEKEKKNKMLSILKMWVSEKLRNDSEKKCHLRQTANKTENFRGTPFVYTNTKISVVTISKPKPHSTIENLMILNYGAIPETKINQNFKTKTFSLWFWNIGVINKASSAHWYSPKNSCPRMKDTCFGISHYHQLFRLYFIYLW